MNSRTSHPDSSRPSYLWWNMAAGLIFAVAACLLAPALGMEISSDLLNSAGAVTWLTLFVGVFLVGCLFWWLIMSLPQRFSLLRGAVVGVLVALFSYPVVLMLAGLLQRNWGVADAGTFDDTLGEILLVTGLTLLTSGFASALVMAVVGMAATWLLVRFHPGTAKIVAEYAARERSNAMRLLVKSAALLAVVAVVSLASVFVWLSLKPLNTAGLAPSASTSVPSENYDDALAALATIRAEEEAGPQLHARCYTQLLTHGEKTDRVIIYFHGLTSCPAQADEMAQKYFDLGYNVLLPRMFGHGEADPLTYSLADLTAEELVDFANQTVDIAQGLGDEVVVLGLSAGGTISSWVSQYRSDVDHSISISPFFGPYVVPSWANHAATNLLLLMPNMMVWWNPLETERPEEMNYAYARYASHALAQVMRLGRIVDSSARTTMPAAAHNGMLLNEADVAVSFDLAEQVVAFWRREGATVDLEVLPFSSRLPHDLIDPRQPGGDVDMVYDLLLDMINGETE